MKRFSVLLALLVNAFLSFSQEQAQGIKISSPLERIVYQRNHNMSAVPVKGNGPAGSTVILARLVARQADQGKTTKWVVVDAKPVNGEFSGIIKGSGGWYSLEVKALNKTTEIGKAKIERVGIGEVFLVVGHSVAQGGELNIEGATDDRVNTVQLDEKNKVFDSLYLKTGDPQYLPDPVFVQAATGVAHAPFGHHNYFWSKFGELLAKKENVPVMIYNAAFGGTSLEHWAKSSQNIQFEHGFVRSGIRMPYINVFNAIKKYLPLTGVRALLADQGANDAGQKSADTILRYYKTFMSEARSDLNYPQLAVVVNRHTMANALQVREAQNRMVKELYSFPGPDYDELVKEDRVDGIHLSLSGEEKAAAMWAAALNREFFRLSKPWIPKWN